MLSLLLFYFPVAGHLGSFHFLVIMNKAAKDFWNKSSCANVSFQCTWVNYLRV